MIWGLLREWLVISGVFLVAAAVLPGVKIKNWPAAFLASAAYAVASIVVGLPLGFLLRTILLPLNVLTFGVLGLLLVIPVNMVVLKFADAFLEDKLEIRGLPPLFILALLTALAGFFF